MFSSSKALPQTGGGAPYRSGKDNIALYRGGPARHTSRLADTGGTRAIRSRSAHGPLQAPKRYTTVSALPRNNYGKVLKTALRQQVCDGAA